jgi:hypothetical protein
MPIVEELRKLGHDVVTAQEAAKAGQKIPDADVLAFAISQNPSVLTRNRRHSSDCISKHHPIPESSFAAKMTISWVKSQGLSRPLLAAQTLITSSSEFIDRTSHKSETESR